MSSSSRRCCTNHPDNFCYICGQYTPPAHRMTLSHRVKFAYKHYFGCQVGGQDKNWAPHICCNRCRTSLLFWLDGKRKQMPFAVPMIWREQNDHISDCYFCMNNIAGKSKIAYPTCKSAPKPVPHARTFWYQFHHLKMKNMLQVMVMSQQVPMRIQT